MIRILGLALWTTTLAVALPGQEASASTELPTNCAELTVTGDGAPGTVLTFDLTGADESAFAVLVIGSSGSYSQTFGPVGTLELGLEPTLILPLGLTDENGDSGVSVMVPGGFRSSLDLFAQGLSVEATFSPPSPPALDFCTSDVEAFHVGN